MHNKGPAPQLHDGSALRIGIVHARWNDTIIEPLLEGTKTKLLECGVKESNIVVQTVPGSWELPIAVQRYVSPPSLSHSVHVAPFTSTQGPACKRHP
jgi:6,7-dimethyl-8-ribityllumazine synthase